MFPVLNTEGFDAFILNAVQELNALVLNVLEELKTAEGLDTEELDDRALNALTELNALWMKSDDPLLASAFDYRSKRLGIALGLFENLTEYCYRRGYAGCVDSKFPSSV